MSDGEPSETMTDDTSNQLPSWFRPTAQVAAAMFLTDDRDRVLLVKPTYDDDWNLPGGVVEVGESPAAAAEREVREEIGLDIRVGPLMCVDHRPPVPGGRGDALRFLFRGGRLTHEQLDGIELAHAEISAWTLVDVGDLDRYLSSFIADRLRSALRCHRYLEEGQPTGGDEVPMVIRIRGPRYRLRPFAHDDLAVVEAAAKDPHIPTITTVPVEFTPEAGRAFIDRQNARSQSGEGWSLAIATADEDRAVGQIGLWPSRRAGGRAEIGYWVASPSRGGGAAAEALELLADWAFENLDLDRISLFIEPWNDASIRTAERAGFEREGVLRSWERVDGHAKDMWSYVRTRT